MKLKSIIISAASISLIFGTIACSKEEKIAKEKLQSKPIQVVLSLPNAQNNLATTDVTGQIEATHQANISTRMMGYITKLQVKIGDHVKAGQLLFEVNNTDLLAKRAQVDASIRQAEAAFHSAQKDYDRFTTLYKQQSASAKELDQITLQYNSVKASLDAAKEMRNEVNAQFSYTHVRAPFSGVVTQKLADLGSLASPGMPILTIEQSSGLQVSVSVPEASISSIQLGDQASCMIKSLNKEITGKVVQINPSSQFSGGQYIVKISIPTDQQKSIYAGMYANVRLHSKHHKPTNMALQGESKILVPLSSIISKGQLNGLYTLSAENTALLRWVRLGKTFGDQVEVLSGLAKNEAYIKWADGALSNGAPVINKQ
ncbi:efflux RND transporter periplasmic adaptor subunit [Cytophagaceae bacterium 50C-KIRBA]|uniref:Efflux RND transporter periplasmic adaptor subunit n=1 Tax=Aquirufa beregesia TaxID=2516556 RepID=A0ABX0EVM5_9BACT|nr:efflux RND transporter periplasmic adaptor subunit [Aquirufa beregesia]NGZ43322.1 efflux RND transporter periplasmic adaptor subunit [Aquirufa beregesia]